MKTLYTSPVITVEELTKVDVLCESIEKGETQGTAEYDNVNSNFGTMADFSNFM